MMQSIVSMVADQDYLINSRVYQGDVLVGVARTNASKGGLVDVLLANNGVEVTTLSDAVRQFIPGPYVYENNYARPHNRANAKKQCSYCRQSDFKSGLYGMTVCEHCGAPVS